MDHILHCELILYVANQQASTEFYSKIFRQEPDLNVMGMTEFVVSANCKVGLMPIAGIENILDKKTPSPSTGTGIPRCELYLCVADVHREYANALNAGAKLISEVKDRDWGDRVCYLADLDGHIIAFAEKITAPA